MQNLIWRGAGSGAYSIAVGSLYSGESVECAVGRCPERGRVALAAGCGQGLGRRLRMGVISSGGFAAVALMSVIAPPMASADNISDFIGGSGQPIPPASDIATENALYVNPLYPGYTPETVFTPEGLYPFVGTQNVTLDTSINEGVTILNSTIQQQVAAGDNLVVYGLSQGTVVESEEMTALAALPAGQAPSADQLSFVLTADPTNPDGGLLSTFPGLSFPGLGITFGAFTPDDTIYTTTIYNAEYDGFADFPRYPINLLADVNAMLGINYVHTGYLNLTPTQIADAVQLPTSPGYDGVTDYFMIPQEPGAELPLLDPLAQMGVPQAFLDLVEPDLRVLVNLGYGADDLGYSLTPANVDTPFGLFPDVSLSTVLSELETATQQGINQFTADLPSLPSQIEAFLDPSTLVSRAEALLDTFGGGGAETYLYGYTTPPDDLAGALAAIVTNDNEAISATANIATALFESLPAYDGTLIENAIQSGNFLDALANPIAADLGAGSVLGWTELSTVANAILEDFIDISSVMPG